MTAWKALGCVRHDFGVDLIASFQQPEDDGLAAGSATSLATHATSAEVRFIGLHVSQQGDELRSHASAILLRILRKIVWVERTEMPVIAAVCFAVRSSKNSPPDAEIALWQLLCLLSLDRLERLRIKPESTNDRRSYLRRLHWCLDYLWP